MGGSGKVTIHDVGPLFTVYTHCLFVCVCVCVVRLSIGVCMNRLVWTFRHWQLDYPTYSSAGTGKTQTSIRFGGRRKGKGKGKEGISHDRIALIFNVWNIFCFCCVLFDLFIFQDLYFRSVVTTHVCRMCVEWKSVVHISLCVGTHHHRD